MSQYRNQSLRVAGQVFRSLLCADIQIDRHRAIGDIDQISGRSVPGMRLSCAKSRKGLPQPSAAARACTNNSVNRSGSATSLAQQKDEACIQCRAFGIAQPGMRGHQWLRKFCRCICLGSGRSWHFSGRARFWAEAMSAGVGVAEDLRPRGRRGAADRSIPSP